MTEVDDIIKEKDLMLTSIQNQEARITNKLTEVEEEIKVLRDLPFCQELAITQRTIQYIDLSNSKELSLNDKMVAYISCINKLVQLIESGRSNEELKQVVLMSQDEANEFRQLADLKVAELNMAKEGKDIKVISSKKAQLTRIICDPFKEQKQEIVDELMAEES